MKNLIKCFNGLIVMVAMMLTMSSCTKEVAELSGDAQIIGSWTMEYINIQNYEDGKLVSETKMYATEDSSFTMEFKEGGEGSALNFDASNPTPEPDNWKLIGDSLILFFDSDASHIDVWTLTHDRLELSLMTETVESGVKKGVRYIISLTKNN